MKKLLLLLFFVTTIAIAGIPLTTNFTVNTALPIDDRMSVADTTARDAIPALKRWEGMLVYSIADGKHYTLIGDITNGDWTELSGGGGNLTEWITATPYVIGNTVTESYKIYVCTVDHTSGTFATDYNTNGYWIELSAGVDLFGDQTITGNKTFSDVTLLGYPGGEPTGVNVNGTSNESSLIISDVGSTKEAQTILHRHSTTLEPLILSARSNSDTDAEADVIADQNMFSLFGTGWKTDNYKIFGSMNIAASTFGTLSSTSAPGKILLNTTPDGATVPTAHLTLDSDKSSIFEGSVTAKGDLSGHNFSKTNLLVNANFEYSSVATGWTVTNATSSISAAPVEGAQALSLNLTKILEIYQNSATNTARLSGLQGLAGLKIKTSDVDGLKVCARNDGVTSSTLCVNIPKDGTWKDVNIPFILSGTANGIAVTSTGSTGTVEIDNAFVGTSAPFQNVNGARRLGSIFYAPTINCEWQLTSSSFNSFSADTDCATPVVSGSAKAPATKIPAIVLPSGSQAGTYYFVATGMFYVATGNYGTWRFHDGTTGTSGNVGYQNTNSIGSVVGSITYTSNLSSDTTINIQNKTNGGQSRLTANEFSGGLGIEVYYFPPESKIYSQNINDYEATDEFVAAITTTTGAKTDENIPWISSCTAANPTVCTFNTNLKDGINPLSNALKCTYSSVSGGNVASINSTSTTLTIGTYTTNGSQTASGNVQVVVHCSKISSDYKARNVIVGSFAGIEKCANDYECTDTFSAKVSGAGIVTGENIDWLNGNCNNPSTGLFNCNFNSNIFTVAPNCTITPTYSSSNNGNATIDTTTSTNTGNIRIYQSDIPAPGSFNIHCQKAGQDYKPKTAKVATSIGVPTVPSAGSSLIDTFSFSFGTTNATTACSASPCSYLDQIGNAVSSVTRSSTGTYTANFTKTYTKLKCSITSSVKNSVNSTMTGGARCESCSSLDFDSVNSSASLADRALTLYCQGSY